MAVAFGSIGTGDYASASSDKTLVLGAPASIANGDLLVAVIIRAAGKTIAPPDGNWTEVQDIDAVIYVATKVANGESGDYTFTGSATYGQYHGAVLRFTGATPTGVAASNDYLTTYNTNVRFADLVVAGSGAGVIWCGGTTTNNYTCSTCSRAGGGATERYDVGGGGDYGALWIWTENNVSAATLSGVTLTLNSDAGNKLATGIYIPAAATTAIPVLLNQYRQRTTH
jgi:hypothetical protein